MDSSDDDYGNEVTRDVGVTEKEKNQYRPPLLDEEDKPDRPPTLPSVHESPRTEILSGINKPMTPQEKRDH